MRLLVIVLCCYSQALTAQLFPPTAYPQGYFRNPLNLPMSLSGNFGELRPNHYHMGLDLKTNARENQPVHAAADGYIARIKIEPAGFGRAIYINHPNGFTTLYAHLNDFNPALEHFLKQQQYQQETWKIDLEIPPGRFPVKKGGFLAYSGNTGGSQAPHLHFEIRRTSDDVNLNPLLFGFPLADNTNPRLLRMALYDRTKSMYEQQARVFSVKLLTGNRYTAVPELITTGVPRISLAMGAIDTHTGSTNPNGIFESILFENEQAVVGFRMDNISYNDTRYLNAHIDYRTKAAGGPYLQQLFELPGFISSIYKHGTSDGVVDISDGQVHSFRIVVKDTYGNSAELTCKVQYNGPPVVPAVGAAMNGMQGQNPVATTNTPAGKMFYPLMLDGYESSDCEFYIGERCLYDSVHIRYSRSSASSPLAVSALHAIGASYIPLQDSFLVRMQSLRPLTEDEKQHTVMQWFAGSRKNVQKVEWQSNWASARFRDFGYYQLLIDNDPPQIVPKGFADGSNLSKASRIVFTIKDNFEKFKNVRTLLDGKWLRFTNDKGRNFIYRFDEKCPAGQHELTITAEDEAGNVTTKSFKFVR